MPRGVQRVANLDRIPVVGGVTGTLSYADGSGIRGGNHEQRGAENVKLPRRL
jgi:hypothetical protein